ncbi:unnamed protein product [Ilex paraguariensis]|uniref:Exostosin GT47 domain-containing protein n=1 Tax=Ilex paraguariensis TaxID=185542 RepID=A0ABC8T1M7_9AQUA
MDWPIQFQKFFQNERRRWLFVVGLVGITHLFCQSLLLPYGNALLSMLPDGEVPISGKDSVSSRQSSAKAVVVVTNSLALNGSDVIDTSLSVGQGKDAVSRDLDGDTEDDMGPARNDNDKETTVASDGEDLDSNPDFVEDEQIDNNNLFEDIEELGEGSTAENVENQKKGFILEKASETKYGLSLEQIVKPSHENSMGNIQDANPLILPDKFTVQSLPVTLPPVISSVNRTFMQTSAPNVSTSIVSTVNNSSVKEAIEVLQDDENHVLLQSNLDTSKNDSATVSSPVKKKMRCQMPPKSVTTIDEMNRLLVRHRARSRAMRPRWSSVHDREILTAKSQIENDPIVKINRELYAPLFRNVSMFKRSYELMERILKVYIYKDGEKPIFHQPIMKGLYASEGWFMKLMEGNKRFVVKDPRKAHLFYMPFSSRMLQYTLYVHNSHNRTNLRQYLKIYSEKIAAKYPFWNRTGGADHFLVACHDWAPYETRHHMEHCIKALCNADVTAGFKIGRDVSLPETYVRSARNPLRDLGGKPPSQRHILAFYAGNMHGYLRPILLKYWKDKDPDMKIFGAMPPGVASRMNYIHHMKSSKYCICPKGYEVNSPRVVEAIFYECVPVIISDNFVPPFFDVLNWDSFSIIIAEKDIPNLKDVLISLPEEKYLEMQSAVRKVQQHFLWHAKPMKYDLFHMTLHSIWYNRVNQIKLR